MIADLYVSQCSRDSLGSSRDIRQHHSRTSSTRKMSTTQYEQIVLKFFLFFLTFWLFGASSRLSSDEIASQRIGNLSLAIQIQKAKTEKKTREEMNEARKKYCESKSQLAPRGSLLVVDSAFFLFCSIGRSSTKARNEPTMLLDEAEKITREKCRVAMAGPVMKRQAK